ncbi:protein toll [Patella vulgata]|uniref:protein toll n=1 Tax=Patella vulgata TaxID=6465 RepID=UPI0021800A44|nr:protein toll [Patella vulgata]
MMMSARFSSFMVVVWVISQKSALGTEPFKLNINPCPTECTCNGNKAIQIKCQVNISHFDITSTIGSFITSLPDKELVNNSIDIRCHDNQIVTWNNTSSFQNVRSLRIENCAIDTQGSVLVFLSTFKINDILFKKVNNGFINQINLRNLKTMTSLSIENCNLTSVPELVLPNNTSKLSQLSFSHNKIHTLDCSFFKGYRCFVEPCVLDFSFNRLESIPRCACETPTMLYTMKIMDNQLSDVSGFHCLKQQHINLDDNSLEELPSFEYGGTITVNANFNQLKSIRRETFKNLRMCRLVDLSYNIIDWIERDAFRGMTQLMTLILTNNKLKEFEVMHAPVGSMWNLHISLKNNQLEYPPYRKSNYEPPQLFKTRASRNPFICDCTVKMLNDRLKEEADIPTPASDPFTTTYSKLSQIFIDAWSYKCSSPKVLINRLLTKVNMSSECPIVKNCPFDCVCTKYLSTTTTLVDCSSRALTQLPQHMPYNSIAIDLNNNSLTSLDVRNYLIRTTGLNVSHNQISALDPGIVPLLVNVTYLDLRNNQLSNLPRSFEDTLFDNSTSIFLSGNAWKCSCENVWMSQWLNKNNNSVSDGSSLQCLNDANKTYKFHDLNPDILKCSFKTSLAILAIILGTVAFIVVAISFVVYKFRYETRVLFYTRLKVHFVSEDVANKQFDAFISYSEHDREFVKTVVNKLENELPLKYKICIHDRDFTVGTPIAENISAAINKSNVVIFVVSSHFSESDWCSFEFQTSYQTMLQHKSPKLVVIKVDELDEDKLDNDLRAYFRTKYFIDKNERLFWDKLIYYLPPY